MRISRIQFSRPELTRRIYRSEGWGGPRNQHFIPHVKKIVQATLAEFSQSCRTDVLLENLGITGDKHLRFLARLRDQTGIRGFDFGLCPSPQVKPEKIALTIICKILKLENGYRRMGNLNRSIKLHAYSMEAFHSEDGEELVSLSPPRIQEYLESELQALRRGTLSNSDLPISQRGLPRRKMEELLNNIFKAYGIAVPRASLNNPSAAVAQEIMDVLVKRVQVLRMFCHQADTVTSLVIPMATPARIDTITAGYCLSSLSISLLKQVIEALPTEILDTDFREALEEGPVRIYPVDHPALLRTGQLHGWGGLWVEGRKFAFLRTDDSRIF